MSSVAKESAGKNLPNACGRSTDDDVVQQVRIGHHTIVVGYWTIGLSLVARERAWKYLPGIPPLQQAYAGHTYSTVK